MAVRDTTSGGPVAGAVVSVLDTTDRQQATGATAAGGVRLLALPGPGTYRVRVRRVGYVPYTSAAFRAGASDTVALVLVVPARPVTLASVQVTGHARCDLSRRSPGDDEVLFALWEQVRTAVLLVREGSVPDEAAQSTPRSLVRPYVARLAGDGRTVRTVTAFDAELAEGRPFGMIAPDTLAARGYVWRAGTGVFFTVPDEQVLLSDAFAEQHCFRLTRGAGEQAGLVGLAFEPAQGRAVPEVAGVMWVDAASVALRYVDFWYVDRQLPADVRGPGRAGGEVHFARLADGRWAVVAWRLRAPRPDRDERLLANLLRPRVVGGPAAGGLGDVRYVEGGASTVAAPAALTPALARLRALIAPGAVEVRATPAADGRAAQGMRITLRQRDDLTTLHAAVDAEGRALGPHPTSLFAATLVLDAGGRGRVDGVPAGAYDLHTNGEPGQGPVGPPQASVIVWPDQTVVAFIRASAAPPAGPATVRALCGHDPAVGTRVVYGTVRTPDGAEALGVTVTARWTGPNGRTTWRTRTIAGGVYAFCRVPRDQAVTLTAADGSSDQASASSVDAPPSADEWEAQALVLATGTAAAGVAPPPAAAPIGFARVTGVVFDSVTRRPLPGALVQFVDSATLAAVASASTDSLGRYQLGPLRPGPYVAGFLHPVLDARGLDPVVVRVTLPPADVVLDFAVPPGTQSPAGRAVRPEGARPGGR